MIFFDLFDITMSLISKNGSGGAGQKRIWSHDDLVCDFFFIFTYKKYSPNIKIWESQKKNTEISLGNNNSRTAISATFFTSQYDRRVIYSLCNKTVRPYHKKKYDLDIYDLR